MDSLISIVQEYFRKTGVEVTPEKIRESLEKLHKEGEIIEMIYISSYPGCMYIKASRDVIDLIKRHTLKCQQQPSEKRCLQCDGFDDRWCRCCIQRFLSGDRIIPHRQITPEIYTKFRETHGDCGFGATCRMCNAGNIGNCKCTLQRYADSL